MASTKLLLHAAGAHENGTCNYYFLVSLNSFSLIFFLFFIYLYIIISSWFTYIHVYELNYIGRQFNYNCSSVSVLRISLGTTGDKMLLERRLAGCLVNNKHCMISVNNFCLRYWFASEFEKETFRQLLKFLASIVINNSPQLRP